jgi:hypothetical protein
MTEYETYGGSPSACRRAGGSGFADHRVLVAEAAPAFFTDCKICQSGCPRGSRASSGRPSFRSGKLLSGS